MKYNAIYMEAWSRRLMTHHAPTPYPCVSPEKSLVVNIAALIAARTIVKRFARDEQTERDVRRRQKERERKPVSLVNFIVTLTLFCRLCHSWKSRRHWGTRTFSRVVTSSDGKLSSASYHQQAIIARKMGRIFSVPAYFYCVRLVYRFS